MIDKLALERQVRDALVSILPSAPMGTEKLMERLYPVATSEPAERRKALSTLLALAMGPLADCVNRGQPRMNSFGKMARPYLWSASGTGAGIVADPASDRIARLERRVQALEALIYSDPA